MASTGFRNGTQRQAAMGRGPGPNCPIVYSVDPTPEAKRQCSSALRALRGAFRPGFDTEAVSRAMAAAEKWLKQWNSEHNRLLNYTTLSIGLRDPKYAPKFQGFHADESLLKFVRGPNQFGKTFLCAAEVWFYFIAKHPWRELPAFWADPSIKKTILIVTGSDQNREGVYNALWETCPIDEVDWVNTHYDKRNKWGKQDPKIISKHTNVEVIFRASNQDTSSLSGFTVHVMWIDEPPEQSTIDELRRSTVAKNAVCLMSFTPIGEAGADFTWLREYVEGDKEYVEWVKAGRLGEMRGKPPIGDWSQHLITIADCPWFGPEEVEKRRRAYRAEQIPQRLYGEWEGATTDRRFGHFDESRHVWSTDLLLQPGFTGETLIIGDGNDHGEGAGTQTSIIVAFDTKTGVLDVLNEVVSQVKTASSDDAENIIFGLNTVGLTPAHVHVWVGDVNTGGKESRGEKQNQLLAHHLSQKSGMRLQSSIVIPFKYNGSVETEEKRLDEAFKENRIRIHSRCHQLLRSLRHYRGKNDKLDKKYKHILDALRYVAQNLFDRYGVCVVYSRYTQKSGRTDY